MQKESGLETIGEGEEPQVQLFPYEQRWEVTIFHYSASVGFIPISTLFSDNLYFFSLYLDTNLCFLLLTFENNVHVIYFKVFKRHIFFKRYRYCLCQ